MSTAGKLNPNVREGRKRRVAVISELRAIRGPRAAEAWALAALIYNLNKSSHLTGAQKDESITRVLSVAKEKGFI